MNLTEHIEKMKKIQESILEYIEKEQDDEENYQNLIILFTDPNCFNNRQDMKVILYLLSHISNNHHRSKNFLEKIEQIFLYFKKYILKFFSNFEIFKYFKNNKRILLFLIEEKIIIIDKSIILEMMTIKLKNKKYPEFFLPEIKPLIDDEIKSKYYQKESRISQNSMKSEELTKEMTQRELEYFKIKRKVGENDDMIAEIIRKDSVDDFISYRIRYEKFSLNKVIKQSIFETNPFLLKNKRTTLIEYAAFYGSIEIFKYLYINEVELTSSLWLYAIHSNDEKIILFLEENEIRFPEESDEKIIKESIKCHHNHIVNYLLNYLANDKYANIDFDQNYKKNIIYYCFHYYNFAFFPKEMKNVNIFCYACKYDYFMIAEILLNTLQLDVNQTIVQN